MKLNVNFFVRAYWTKVSIAILMCILFLSLPSCEEEIKTHEELLIGTWLMVSHHYIGYEDGVKTGDYTNEFDPYECTILLQKDGTGKEYRYEGYGYYFSEDTFFWRITYDSPCVNGNGYEGSIILYGNDEFGQEVPINSYCFNVNENYLTLHFSYEYECPLPPSDGPNPWLIKGGGSNSSGYWCNYSEWLSLKRQ